MSEQGAPEGVPTEAVAPEGTTEAPTTEAPQAGSPQADILSQMSQRLESIPSHISQAVADAMAQQNAEPEAETDAYGNPVQYDQYGQPVDPYGLDPQDPRDAMILQMQQQQAQLAQQAEQLQSQNYSRDVQAMISEFPQMSEPAVAQAIEGNLQEAGWDVNNPQMIPVGAIKMAFKAYQADQYASQQTPVEGSQQPGLESGGAMQPAEPEDPATALFGQPRQQTAAFPWAQK